MASQLHRFTQASLLQTFSEPFVALGGRIADVIDRCGLPNEALEEPSFLIDADATYRAIDLMAKDLDDPYFAANIVREAAQHGVSMLRESGVRSQTLGDFLLGAMVEVRDQFTNVRYHLEADASSTKFIIKRQFHPRAPLSQVDAAAVVFYAEIIRLAVRDDFSVSDLGVTVTSSDGFPPDYLPRSSINVTKFNGQILRFPTHWLSCGLTLDWEADGKRRRLVTTSQDRQSALRTIEELAEEHLSKGDLNLGVIGRLCGMHPRNLQRELARQGTSFRKLLDGVRQRHATELLSRTKTPINQIAFAVGFSGTETFSRAFRRWTGLTPTEYRSSSSRQDQNAQEILCDSL